MTYPNNITDLDQSIRQIQYLGLPLQRCARSQSFTLSFREKVLTVLYFILFLCTLKKKKSNPSISPIDKK